MKYGYARVSTDGQSVDAQGRQLIKAGCKKSFARPPVAEMTNNREPLMTAVSV
jgi:DNA invertase Pin-like site-specific DNA recombinase